MPKDRKSGEDESMKEGWHLDKKVPLSIIIALLIPPRFRLVKTRFLAVVILTVGLTI